ncbi:hypothetical protein [Planktothrix sp.]
MFYKPRRILSFDSAGIRGLLTPAMLEEVEDKVQKVVEELT